ncbi:VWA domain-containing protein, partial [bacterium]|nr:VWA domain-containing protein [bacterium]
MRGPGIHAAPGAGMIPFLTYPLALAALAALPALAAIYLLRNRFRRRQVSSLVLWSFPVPLKEGGARLNRLQLPLIFFLELLALLLLVAAATGPHLRLAQSVRPLTVVLDDSFSMLAGTGQETPRRRAFRSLENLFRLQPPPATRLVLAGLEPRLLGAPARTWPEVAALLEEWRCQAPAAALEQALQLAAESGTSQANLLVLTDQPPPQERIDNDRLQWRSFGNPVPNLAIVNASRVPYGEEDRCLLEVANYAASPLDSRLVVR